MKKFVKIAALVFAAGMSATIAGCSGCAGCNSDAKNVTLTNSNWYTGTSYKGIQPSFIVGENPEYKPEKITYSVSHDGSKAMNTSYSVEYRDGGSYTTEFYAAEYDWSDEKIPQGYRTEGKEIVYYYRTEFTVSVRYALKKGDTTPGEWSDDSVIHESYFRAAGQSLQPLYSRQVLKTTSPANLQATTLDGAFKRVDETYENFYNKQCTEVISIKNGNVDEAKTFNLKKVKNTLFDNSSLYIAVRSMRLNTDFSQRISLFAAADGGVADRVVTVADKALGEEERNTVTAEMQRAKLYVPEKDDGGLKTVAADINFAGGNLTGTTQTVWYAAIENPDYNVPRATMVKLSIPLSYSLGTLNFTLQTIDSTLWNG